MLLGRTSIKIIELTPIHDHEWMTWVVSNNSNKQMKNEAIFQINAFSINADGRSIFFLHSL